MQAINYVSNAVGCFDLDTEISSSKQTKNHPKKQRDLYFIWHISTDCSVTTIWELLLEAVRIKLGMMLTRLPLK